MKKSNFVNAVLKSREKYLVLIILAMMLIFTVINPVFLSGENFHDILRSNSVLGIVALGATLIIITGGIDVSVGAVIAAVTVVTGRLMAYSGFALIPTLLIGLVCGLAIGMINGLLVGKAKLPAIVATLGLKSIIEGVVFLTTGGKWVNNHEMPKWFLNLSSAKFIGIGIQIWVLIAAVLITWFICKYTLMGRTVFAIGGNRESALRAGINPIKTYLFAYGYAGVLAGLAAIVHTSIVVQVDPWAFKGFEMQVIATVVVGGASMSGGKGSVFGTILGFLFLAMLKNGMILVRISAYYQEFIVGLIILTAITIDTISKRIAEKKLTKIDVKE